MRIKCEEQNPKKKTLNAGEIIRITEISPLCISFKVGDIVIVGRWQDTVKGTAYLTRLCDGLNSNSDGVKNWETNGFTCKLVD